MEWGTEMPEQRQPVNIVSSLTDEEKQEIASTVIGWVTNDLTDRAKWETRRDEAVKLWACEPPERQPIWPGGANVSLPMLASAVNNWSGLASAAIFESPYPERVQAIAGEMNDVRRAKRVKGVMNWQLTFEMEGEYEESYDSLLPEVAIDGVGFHVLGWDKKNERPKVEFETALNVILPNDTKKITSARRITRRLRQHPEDIKDLGEDKFYVVSDDFTGQAPSQGGETQPNPIEASEKARQGLEEVSSESEEHTVWECHFKGKLPGTERKAKSGKWIVTVVHATGDVVRVVEHPKKIKTFFVDFHFIPSPTTGFYSYGWSQWIKPLNDMESAAFNQFFDAGRITNSPHVFYGRTAGLRGKKIQLTPGGSTEVNDATQIQITKFPALDQNLPLIIGFLKEFGQDITANTDEMQGRAQKGVREPTVRGQNVRVSRSLSRFKVLAKRIFRAQRRELLLIYDLNALYLPKDKQFRILGSDESAPFDIIRAKDFGKRLHVMPTSDPDFASAEERRAEALQIMSISQTHALIGLPNPETGQVANPAMFTRITRRFLEAYGEHELARYLPTVPDPPLNPHAENMLFAQGETEEPKQGEPHAEHMAIHEAYTATDTFVGMDRRDQRALQFHIVMHQRVGAEEEVLKRQVAAQEAAAA